MARGSVCPGSRTSPEILLTSHHPPKEKKAPTMAAPSAGPKASEPGLWATKGAKFDHDPKRSASAQITRNPSKPSFSQVVQRKKPALTRTLKMFNAQSAQITAAATNLVNAADNGKMNA